MSSHAPSGTLPNVEAFCQTFATGSFTKAARALGVTPQATSRSVARLERTLGVELFRRTTRQLAPTDAARRYYERCVQALQLFAVAEREVAAGHRVLEGVVRISAPTTYGHHRLLPSLAGFRELYPGIRVEINIANRNVDFVSDGFDLAIRMGAIVDGSLIARRLGDFPVGVYAAPSYLARVGVPRAPDDLATHSCIAFVVPSTGRVLPWSFVPGPQRFRPDAAVRCSDDPLALITLARAGVGLTQIYDFLVEDDVKHGRLVEVLTSYRGRTRPFSLVYPRAAAQPRAVRALVDHIVAAGKPSAAQDAARSVRSTRR
jgi:DNA-binding transcriptional LysR family regulator